MDRKVGSLPPENLEKLVRWLVPAPSREHVVGDLNERYRSPGKYLVDALCVLPFVIASRVRRSSSFSRVAFRAFILWYGAFLGPKQESWLAATLPALLATVALILRDAYRPTAPSLPSPTPPRAAAFDIALVCISLLLVETVLALWAPELLLTRQTFIFGVPFGCAVLFILRVQNPPTGIWAIPTPGRLSYTELVAEVRGYEAVLQRALRIELALVIVFVVLALIMCFPLRGLMPAPIARLSFAMFAAGGTVGAFFLHKRMRFQAVPEGLSFAETVARYRDSLEFRVTNARTYVWWYLVPVLLGPTVLVLDPILWHPRPLGMPAAGAISMAIAVALILVARRASMHKYQQRIDQLAVVAEKV